MNHSPPDYFMYSLSVGRSSYHYFICSRSIVTLLCLPIFVFSSAFTLSRYHIYPKLLSWHAIYRWVWWQRNRVIPIFKFGLYSRGSQHIFFNDLLFYRCRPLNYIELTYPSLSNMYFVFYWSIFSWNNMGAIFCVRAKYQAFHKKEKMRSYGICHGDS